jgi:RND family efflux transporter MFP subunit
MHPAESRQARAPSSPMPRVPTSRGRIRRAIAAAAVAAIGLAVYTGIRGRVSTETNLARATDAAAVPAVTVVHPQANAPSQEIVLPGYTEAFMNAPIYARTSGYLKRWYFDIGAHVRTGTLLAEIETPELDQQLQQARAQLTQDQAALAQAYQTLQQASANYDLAVITERRWSKLTVDGWAPKQAGDNYHYARVAREADLAHAQAGIAVAQATFQAQRAAVARLEQLQSYEKVYAPFDGVITARHTDVGALIDADANSPSNELFNLEDIKVLRVYVAVPETEVRAARLGADVTLTLDEFPGQVFKGTLARTSDAINLSSRTLLAEVDVDNGDDKLLPGAYIFVHLSLPTAAHSVAVPADTLLFRKEGLCVAVVRNSRAELLPVKIGHDYGDQVEVVSGLSPDEAVIVDPSDSLTNGTEVHVANS